MRAPATVRLRGNSGYFRIHVIPPTGRALDVTIFRDVPTLVTNYGSADPFGDSVAALSFPQITMFDRPGTGDLWWLVPWSQVTFFWYDVRPDGVAVRNNSWVWEGIIVSEEVSTAGYSVQCKGTLYQSDNFLAAPFYPQYPVPYELLIARTLDPIRHPSLKNKKLIVEYPADWNVVVPQPATEAYLWYLRPMGVTPGNKWSGLTTRTTGSWDQSLTGFIQTLLGTMYTPDGDQWTVMKRWGRQPVLKVRRGLRYAEEDILTVYAGVPGVDVTVSRDFTQSANVIYGTGTDLAKSTFSGAQVTPDGSETWYEPFAALPQVYPDNGTNPRLIKGMVRKESQLTFSAGIDELTARETSVTQIRRFADPGYTGTISLTSDPTVYGVPFNRLLIQAGSPIMVHNLRGTSVLFHISAVSVDPQTGSVSLTVDSKFRDALTVAEVRARTRDALNPTNALQVGAYSVTVQDLLKPWSYADGSGVIPSGGKKDATPLFKKMDANAKFPWTAYTTKYPPSKNPEYYIKLRKKGTDAKSRWQDNGYDAAANPPVLRSLGVPIKGASNGSIRLTQLAAYKADGTVAKVSFHVGIYGNSGINTTSMPNVPKGGFKTRNGVTYAAADKYPMYPGAFEQREPSGEEQSEALVYLLPEGAGLIVAWGTYYDPAGYSPGLFSAGGQKTGMLVDETNWTFDTTGYNSFDKYSVPNNTKNAAAGMMYLMIYCDDTVDDLYFLGRLYRQEPGGN